MQELGHKFRVCKKCFLEFWDVKILNWNVISQEINSSEWGTFIDIFRIDLAPRDGLEPPT